MTFLYTHNFACTDMHAKPFHVHENQCTQILNLLSPVRNISIIFFFLRQDLKVSGFFFLFWEMIKNIYEINQHGKGNYPMKCSLNNFLNFVFL